MDFRTELRQDRGVAPVRTARTTLAYSLLLFGVAGSIAAVPVLIWLIFDRGLQ